MPNPYTSLLDRFLTRVPVEQLNEAELFVREVKFMCSEFMETCPIVLFKEFDDIGKGNYFRTKNRHRSLTENGAVLNAAMQHNKAFESGLDLYTTSPQEGCVVILPNSYQLTFSRTDVQQFVDSAKLADPAALAQLAFDTDVNNLTESSQYVMASKVPFYYCIRI